MKMPGLKLKYLLKKTMRGILPEEILKKPKKGFNVPMSRWLKTSLRPLLEEYLSPVMIKRQGCLNPGPISRLLADHLTGRADYSRNLWALLNFSLWRSNFC
jgi:asparagine synthase (glutamine-hydrolysing)